jgi:hypothetical protein
VPDLKKLRSDNNIAANNPPAIGIQGLNVLAFKFARRAGATFSRITVARLASEDSHLRLPSEGPPAWIPQPGLR